MTLLGESLAHTWEPFVLVVGLLFIGHVAAREGLFEYVGSRCALVPGSDAVLLAVTMTAVALVTATLNLDTAVVFMTPVALQAARSRSADETAFLYGTILMTNSASLLLLGSNLTNMLVFASQPVRGSVFTQRMSLAWLASVVLTIALVMVWRWRPLHVRRSALEREASQLRPGPGAVAVAVAVVLMLSLSHPALPVLVIGMVVEGYGWLRRRRVDPRGLLAVANPTVVAPLFVVAVLVGWLGRTWTGPSNLLTHSGTFATASVAAIASVAINNLPAASLFAGRHVAHPYALLVGLDLGPNLFMTGALSSLLWFRIARSGGATPSVARFALIGVPVALVTIAVSSLVI